MGRRLAVLAAVVTAWLAAAGLTHAQDAASSTVSVQMTGAGTVTLEMVTGGPVTGCPARPPLANPDNGPPLAVCSHSWAPTCTPASGAATCELVARATARVPGPPDLQQSELGGWSFLSWSSGPCARSTSPTCTFSVGRCASAGACTWSDVELGVAFDDTRAPTAVIVDGPPAVSTAPDGVASFLLRSTEYAQLETSRLQCRMDAGAWAPCAARPDTHVLAGVPDGPHTLAVRAIDPSGHLQTAPPAVARWTQRYPPVTTFDAGPATGATVNTPDVVFAFHADRPAAFECRLDAGEWTPCASGFEALGLADGRHELDVRATRTDADVSAIASTWFAVDTLAPASVILSGPDGETTQRTATLTFRAEPPADGVRLECALDDAPLAPCDEGRRSYSELPLGEHRFAVQAVDAAGNREDPPQEWTWTVVDPRSLGTDADGDGDFAPPLGEDCDDKDPDVSSLAEEIAQNGVDDDCDGEDRLKPGAGVRFRARWEVTREGSRLVELTALRVAAGTRLTLSVTCPRRTCRSRVKPVQVPRARKELPLLPYLGGRLRLVPGAVLEARAGRRGRNTEGRTWKVRARRPPRSTEFCLRGKARETGRC